MSSSKKERVDKFMVPKVDEIIKSALFLNGDTLFVKLACLMPKDDIAKVQSQLQSQTDKVKIIILPNAIELAGVGADLQLFDRYKDWISMSFMPPKDKE